MPVRRVSLATVSSEEPMVRATWNGAVLAECNDTVVVEGNHYFPPHALNRD